MHRRSFLAGLGAFLTFPSVAKAFVRPENPVKVMKGKSKFDAGMFYCPYVPNQVSENNTIMTMVFDGEGNPSYLNVEPKIFKTRYNLVDKPF